MKAVQMNTKPENELPQPEKGEEVSFSTLLQDIAVDVPEVQQNAVDAHNAERKKIEELKDADGVLFDRNLHATKKDGAPAFTSKGAFRKKAGSSRAVTNPKHQKGKQQEQVENAVSIRETSYASAKTVQELKRHAYKIGLGMSYSEDTHTACVDTTAAYFVEKGGVKMSPLMTLAALELSIAAQAMQTPKAKTWWEKTQIKLGAWWKLRQTGKTLKQDNKDNGAHLNRGTDGKREDNGGDTNGAPD